MAGFVTTLLGASSGGEQQVELKEFDLTKFAGRLGLATAPVVAAVLAALDGFGVVDVKSEPGIVAAALGVVGLAFVSFGIVAAADIVARAYADRTGRTVRGGSQQEGSVGWRGIASPAPGCMLWHGDDSTPVPVIAVGWAAGKTVYLVPRGSRSSRTVGGNTYEPVFDSKPTWLAEDDVTAFHLKSRT